MARAQAFEAAYREDPVVRAARWVGDIWHVQLAAVGGLRHTSRIPHGAPRLDE